MLGAKKAHGKEGARRKRAVQRPGDQGKEGGSRKEGGPQRRAGISQASLKAAPLLNKWEDQTDTVLVPETQRASAIQTEEPHEAREGRDTRLQLVSLTLQGQKEPLSLKKHQAPGQKSGLNQ